MVNKKMLIAPILAVVLAFLLAGSVSFLPQSVTPGQASPQPTSFPSSTLPPLPSTAPVSKAESGSSIVPIFFAIAAIIVVAVTALLLFSEKNLKKEITA
jgi:hypothetical protein